MTNDDPTIEMLYHDCGYVYVGKTQMGFSPIRTALGNDGGEFKGSNGLLLWAEIRWPTENEMRAIIEEMKKAFPDREIFIYAEGEPIPVAKSQ